MSCLSSIICPYNKMRVAFSVGSFPRRNASGVVLPLVWCRGFSVCFQNCGGLCFCLCKIKSPVIFHCLRFSFRLYAFLGWFLCVGGLLVLWRFFVPCWGCLGALCGRVIYSHDISVAGGVYPAFVGGINADIIS